MVTKPLIKSWSFSRLSEFELCKYRTKLKVVDKIPEPERPLKPGQTEHANDRGSRIHNECEQFVRGALKTIPKEAESFSDEFESLKASLKRDPNSVQLEQDWGFNRQWEITDYRSAWLRVKCDAVLFQPNNRLVVVDYKTGRKFGNEIKHGEQVQLYALAAAVRFPTIQHIDVELWYLDQDDLTHMDKPASKWLRNLKLFDNRGRKMTDCVDFPPNPNAFSCKWCPYKDGICEYAYTDEKAVKNVFQRKALAKKGIVGGGDFNPFNHR